MQNEIYKSQLNPTVLVLDDEKNIRKSIEIALSQENIHVLLAHDPAAALRILAERIVDLMIVDIRLGEIDGLAFYKKVLRDGFNVPIIFISGHGSLTEAAQAVQMGAYDFVEKPFSAEKITTTVKRCLEFHQLTEKVRSLSQIGNGEKIIGETQTVKRIILDAERVAKTNANVLIAGESGTGKELIANLIYSQSDRAGGPFVKVNCSAIPENLVESELFGFEKGAFTGAVLAKKGFFEIANRGIIFLDEVADLSLQAQAKLLRVLQSGEVQKVGSEKVIKVDVRVLSGTHKDLKLEVAHGRFREDLFYRLNVVPLKVPSLRDRPEDIPLLIKYFSKVLSVKNNLKEKSFDDDVVVELKRYRWPGNIRELQNVLERMIILSGAKIGILDLPEEIMATSDESGNENQVTALKDFRNRAEREFIINTMKRNLGNISQSALELGVGRTYLHKRLNVLNIEKKDFLVD